MGRYAELGELYRMKHLLEGNETEETLDILLGFTRMDSKGMKKALRLHLVEGWDEELSISCSGVSQSNFSRDLKKLNVIAEKIYKFTDFHRNNKQGNTK